MIPERALWQRARAAFDELVDLDPAVRGARLQELKQDDVTLYAAVARLLDADSRAEDALRDYSFGSLHAVPAAVANSRDPLGIVGHVVSHFRITDFVAAGGMGVVYAAQDVQLGRTVALKFPLPQEQLDRAGQERFVNEARSVASLDHPNLCSIHEIGESEHGVFLAMPLYSGETLRDRLDRTGALATDEAIEIVRQVTCGLVAAHEVGIVHRDLKPGNLMLLVDGSVKILDFGLAKIRDVNLTKSRMTLGTIGYVAPEQVRRRPVDARADMWAVGVMLYEMLTGTLPFRGEHEVAILHAVLHEEPRRPSEVNRALTPAIDNLIGALMQKDPAARYQSSGALLADLEALQSGASVRHRAPFWSRSVRRRRVRAALLPAGAVVLVAIGGASWGIKFRADRVDLTRAESARAPVLSWVRDTADIRTAAQLLAAMDPVNTGRAVRLAAGTYDMSSPITVPDGMTLIGAGVMEFDAQSLPTGFTDATRSTIRMLESSDGSVISLGHRTTLRGLEIVDLEGRSGNVIAVASRRPRDSVDAAIIETVIVNANPLAIGASGALGRGLWVTTQNPNMGKEPAPHEGSVVSVHMTRSIIRSPSGGGGFFAYNFAAESGIRLEIAGSVIGGSNEANGGVSRPDAVHDSNVHLVSTGNLYRNEWMDPCVSPLLGWNFTGGSGAPIPIRLPATTRNQLRVQSVNDRLEGFTTGVIATGGRRFFAEPLNAAPTDNHIELQLIGTTISTPACEDGDGTTALDNTAGIPAARKVVVADLRLTGAAAEIDRLHPGDRNTVRVELRGVTGSGRRSNRYIDEGGPLGELPAQFRGSGNRLEIVGDPQSFARTNRAIAPAPAPKYFKPIQTAAAREPVSAAIRRFTFR
ncbi:serine/threonine-protein kinase [Gemmatimonas sp.]|uniref:serine/threonine-protein kinase n=1 Tax=Gemmatimonas sp. TaxID=1962908 RepID=UPI00286DB177|nr:serine/threonine-protein kinase [Gemmatimonas sp.]